MQSGMPYPDMLLYLSQHRGALVCLNNAQHALLKAVALLVLVMRMPDVLSRRVSFRGVL